MALKPLLVILVESTLFVGDSTKMMDSLAQEKVALYQQPDSRYIPPTKVKAIGMYSLLEQIRPLSGTCNAVMALPGMNAAKRKEQLIYYAGDIELLNRKCVAVVGSRKVSPQGAARARRLARELVAAGVVVVSGLAAGVDTNAHQSAIDNGGKTVAVIGTPLDKAFPSQNAALQQQIYREHLLISPFLIGSQIWASNFVKRNQVMAALSDVTVIIEATENSGSLYQADACCSEQLKRWLFIAQSIVDNKELTWPKRYLDAPNVRILRKTSDILEALQSPP